MISRCAHIGAWFRQHRVSHTNSHDFNDELGNGESFKKTCDWTDILLEWKLYVSKQFGEHPQSSFRSELELTIVGLRRQGSGR